MNYFKNGTFVSNRIEPWTVTFLDPGQITMADNAVRMPLSSQIKQHLEMDEIGDTTAFVFRVKARTAFEAATSAQVNPSNIRVTMNYQYGNTFTGVQHSFDVTDQWQTLEGQFVLNPPEPLRVVSVTAWVVAYPGPGYDRRDIWFTGFELEPLVQTA